MTPNITPVRNPIAVVGIGCRFPRASGIGSFWDLLRSGTDAVTGLPSDRWDETAVYDANPLARGKTNCRWGAFLDKPDDFDWRAFRITPREAKFVDPQHRLALEVSWEALEDAGIPFEEISGTRTGVFMGIMWNDYLRLQCANLEQLDGYSMSGSNLSFVSNRISHFFDLQGPSIAMDVGCASSLTAIHLACASLWNGETTLALAGGVNLILSIENLIAAAKAGVLSPSGRCKTFDRDADGFVPGEGAGIVVLKPLDRAISDGDRIYSVIRGTASNHNGSNEWIMATSFAAQEALLRSAYRAAGVDPACVDYVELHGTGTKKGDPVEARAVGKVLGAGRPADHPCLVGSVKTNIGHLEAAAGVASVIKVSLALYHRAIPPTLHLQNLNPDIPLGELGIAVQQSFGPWPRTPGKLPLAGVTSLSFGGGNAHVVLEAAPEGNAPQGARVAGVASTPSMLPISARTPESLRSLVHAYARQLKRDEHLVVEDVCYTAGVRRTHHECRLAVVFRTRDQLLASLDAFLANEPRADVASGQSSDHHPTQVAFVFAAGASARVIAEQSRQLAAEAPVFRASLERWDQTLGPKVERSSVVSRLADLSTSRDEQRIDPYLGLAIQLALVDMLRAYGVAPSAVLGQGLGVLAAAHASGCLSAQDLVTLLERDLADLDLAAAFAETVRGDAGGILFFCSGADGPVKPERWGPREWARALSDTGQLAPSIERLRSDGYDTVVELGPRGVEFAPSRLVSMPHFETLRALGSHYALGGKIEWRSITAAGRLVTLPTYAWQHERLWFASTARAEVAGTKVERPAHILALSAPEAGALGAEAEAFLRVIATEPALPLGDLCHRAALRTHHEHRVAIVATTRHGLVADLTALALGQQLPANCARGRASTGRPKIAFLFAGQGAQSVGMGRSLFETQPIFREALLRCAAALDPHLDRHLLDLLYSKAPKADTLINETQYAQPALFAIAVSLAELWRSWGIEPDVVVGQSQGEIAAACVAGALTLEDAAKVVCRRSRLLLRLSGRGGMAALGLSEVQARERIAPYGEHLSIAVVSSPSTTIVSGEPEALQALLAQLERESIFCRLIKVSYASHSAQIDPLRKELLQLLSDIAPRAGSVPFRSTVTCETAQGETLGPDYWVRNLRMPCRFATAIEQLLEEGVKSFIEMSPHPALSQAMSAFPGMAEGVCVSSLRRGEEDWSSILASLTQLHVRGVAVDWQGFERSRSWVRTRADLAPSSIPSAAPATFEQNLYEIVWRVSTPRVAPVRTEGRWLVLGGAELGEQVARELESRGARCTRVVFGDAVERERDRWSIDPKGSEQIERVCAEVLAGDVRGIVHLVSLDQPILTPEADRVEPTESMRAQLLGALHLVKTVANFKPTPIFFVTRGVIAVNEAAGPISAAQSPLWGLARVASLEHPDCWGAMIDLAPHAERGEAEALLGEILVRDEEDHVAIRGGTRHVARLVRYLLPAKARGTPLVGTGTWLITGGLGALGQHVARWLVKTGVRHIVLTGRRGLATPGAKEGVAALEAIGATVRVVAADVALEQDVVKVLATPSEHGFPGLRGVVHAAGVSTFRALAETTSEDLESTLAAKTRGAWLLHRLTRDQPLESFILFSSGASMWGSAGQGAYAAANAYLDALAHERRRTGLPGLSVNYGPWAGGGMATDEFQSHLERMGMPSFSPESALLGLEALVLAGATQVGYAQIDWSRFREVYEARRRRPLLAEMTSPPTPIKPLPSVAGPGQWSTRLKDALAKDRLNLLSDLLREEVAAVLSLKLEDVAPQRGFFNLGMDSLVALEFGRRLEAQLGIRVPPPFIFNHPTVERLAKEFLVKLGLEEERKVASVVRAAPTTEPIAIVGVACRFPGGANDPSSFWSLLDKGVDAVQQIPRERWDVDAYYDPDPDARGKTYVRYAALMDAPDRFDPEFFGISPREATTLDPQQRLLLETSFETFEAAGIVPDTLRTTRVGVYVGMAPSEYLPWGGSIEAIDAYAGTGNFTNMAAGRLSFSLGVQGPSVTVDTACSSSLVALHLACQSLRQGECDVALAGGVNVLVSPSPMIVLARLRAVAPDGRCKAFSSRADGFGRGEGCGMVLLKRISEARSDGDRILAIVRGSAINHDGPSSGLTVPNGKSQEATIRLALANAGLSPADISYVEAHGTGTQLGDPIEVEALGAVFAAGRQPDRPLLIGTVKTNIGHLESAAGMAGLLKVVLSLSHEKLPAHLHCGEKNPHVAWDKLPIEVTTESRPWPRGEKPRFAGISSFGMSGTNAHVILEEGPPLEVPATKPGGSDRPVHILTLSAKTPKALEQQVHRFCRHLATHPEIPVADACHTASVNRTHFEHRLAVLGSTREKLLADLESLSSGGSPANVVRGKGASAAPRAAFLFTGQGAQYAGMGRALFETQPVFRKIVEECAKLLAPHLTRPLLEILYPVGETDARRIDETSFTQPALFVLEYALTELWRSWGIVPDSVIGHSIGEYAAACVAGVFSLEDALRLIAARGRLMQSLPSGGAMLSVRAGEEQVRAAIGHHGDTVWIAGLNSPDQIVLSGAESEILAIGSALERQGIETKRLTVSHAFHSHLMAPIVDEFRRVADSVSYASPRIPLFSNIEGREAKEEIASPDYWVRHLLAPVRFADGIAALGQRKVDAFVEVGPKPTLLALAQACLPEASAAWLPSLRRDKDDGSTILASLSELYVRGAVIDWKGFDAPFARQRVDLPTYPFQRERYWVKQQARTTQAVATRSLQSAPPLAGVPLSLPNRAIHHVLRLGISHQPYLDHHMVYGQRVVPGVFHLAAVLAVAGSRLGDVSLVLQDVVFTRALFIDERDVELHVVLAAERSGGYTFEVSTEEDPNAQLWRTHVTGRVRVLAGSPPPRVSISDLQPESARSLTASELVELIARRSIGWGPKWTWTQQISLGVGTALATLRAPEGLEGSNDPVPPAMLDTSIACTSLSAPPDVWVADAPYLPFSLEELRFYGGVRSPAWCHGRVRRSEHASGKEVLTTDIDIIDHDGNVRIELRGMTLKRAPEDMLKGDGHRGRRSLYELAWREESSPTAARLAGTWLVLTETDPEQDETYSASQALTHALGQAGASVLTAALREGARQGLERALSSCGVLAGVIVTWEAGRDQAGMPQDIRRRCAQVLELATRLGGSSTRVMLVAETSGAAWPALEFSPLAGLVRVMRQEYPELHATIVEMDCSSELAANLVLLCADLGSAEEPEIIYRAGKRLVPRLIPTAEAARRELVIPDSPNYRLAITERGLLENLELAPAERRPPDRGQVEIAVEASGLNFRDVLNALDQYPGDPGPLGLELTGRVVAVGAGVTALSPGDPVIAMDMSASGFARFVTADARRVCRRPSGLCPSEAATLPGAFLTAWYGLFDVGGLKKGDQVLIHAAAGGVGLAAVQLALRAGATVFATASLNKWPALRRLGVQHLASSRTLQFADDFRRSAGTPGIDVVLNSLTGAFIDKSLELLKPGGRFVEMGKRDLRDPATIRSKFADVVYLPFDLADVSAERIHEMLSEVAAAVETGELRPLPTTTFPIARAEQAFRTMAEGKHIGKIVLLPARGPVSVRSDAVYLITGGLGALGLHAAGWLAGRGARRLVLVGRRAPSDLARSAIAELEAAGVTVRVSSADVSDRRQVQQLLDAASLDGPLRGVIHAAGVLEDGVMSQQTPESFARVLSPKVDGACNLHELTREKPLDFFVLYSSVSAVLGWPGQSNYAAANAFLDALAMERHSQGLPCLSIAWGAWSESGMAARLDASLRQRQERLGLGLIEPREGLRLLEEALSSGRPYAAAVSIDASKLRAATGDRPMLRELDAVGAVASAPESTVDLLSQLRSMDQEQRAQHLCAAILEDVARILGVAAPASVPVDRSLRQLGLDSLMALELRNRLSKRIGKTLPTTLAFDYPTVEKQVRFLLEKVLGFAEIAPPEHAAAEESVGASVADLSGLTDDEVIAKLAKEMEELPPS